METVQAITEIFAGWSPLCVFLRLFLAVVVGVIIGLDRELKNRGIGIKTHVLVCLGAALVMIVSEYIYHRFPEARSDMSRMGAQVISGVGFLGVGTIVVTGRNTVRGLTTAAGLWASACVGLAAGMGYLWGTLAAVVLIVFTHKVLSCLENRMHKYARVFEVYIEFESNKAIREFLQKMRQQRVSVANIEVTKNTLKGEGPVATMTLKISDWKRRGELLRCLQGDEHLNYFEGI